VKIPQDVARLMGVAQQTVSDWLGNNTGAGNPSAFDSRIKIPPKARDIQKAKQKVAVQLKVEGKTQPEIGRLMGITQQAVSLWLSGNSTSACNPSVPDCRWKIPPKAGASLGEQNRYAEVQVRARRRAGELLRAMPKQHGARDGKRSNSVLPRSLTEIGVPKMEAHRLQVEASLPASEFERVVAETMAVPPILPSPTAA
jgi:predicted transcriptional regulator